MTKKVTIAFFFVLTVCLPVNSQQLAQYSQWSFNHFSINPALSGIKNCLDVRTAYRMQWAGFEDAPQSGLFTINAPLRKKRESLNSPFHGLGAKLERDIFGHFNNVSISLAYALHFPLDKEEMLSFGVSGGIQQFGFDHTNVTTIEPDQAVAQSANMFLIPLVGGGAWYNNEHFFVGASIDQLARNQWDEIGFTSRFQMHGNLTTGTRWTFDNNNSLLPSVLVRIPPAGPVSFDLNLMFDFTDNILFGLGYRNTDALIGFMRVKVKRVTIGYSFDFITSAIQGGNFNTHEVSILYNNCREPSSSRTPCPLFE